MSIALVVTAGFGNGTFNGTIKDVVLRGYGISDVILAVSPGFGVGSVITNNGLGILSAMSNAGVGKAGSIVFGFGVGSVITNNGLGKTGSINNDGVGEEGDI